MSGRLNRYPAKTIVFLITAALLAAMGGCPGGYNPAPSQNLEIRTWYDLDAIRNNLAGNHSLMNDLNSTTPGYYELAGPTADGGKGWDPITGPYITDTGPVGFWGTFDGQGYEIRDLFINRPDEDSVGLFGVVWKDGVIKDIGVMGVTMTGEYGVGGLAGSNSGTVANSYSSCNVTGHECVGGLVGYNYYGTVSNSYSTGKLTGYEDVGGLVGFNKGWGGGELNEGSVSDSYATGSVTGDSKVGGLVGYNEYAAVKACYSTGSVTGNEGIGGLVGRNYGGSVYNSYWDIETSGQNTSAGIGARARNTTEMKDIATFSGVDWSGKNWNIVAVANPGERDPSYIWNIVNNLTYPFLSWQT
jgi:The GLUG motif